VDVVFLRSATRHGISAERALYVMTHCVRPNYVEAIRGEVVLFFGPDQGGVPLEVGAVEREDGGCVVIHAMRLRRRYAASYAEEMRCR
jgi:hypothetical protein